jgi:type III pantothenate kinase
MLLAIDVGNSTISAGLFDRKRELKFLASIDTDSRKTADQISIDLMNLFAGNAGTGHFLSDIEQKPGA